LATYQILIVDDDPKEHQVLGDYLKISGYDVFHAKNGKQGMEIIASKSPDLILLDIQMPVMDGFQMLKIVRKDPAFKHIYVILLSSLNRDFLKRKGLELGANDYIVKPFRKGDLIARVNRLFRESDRNQPRVGVMQGLLSDLGLSDLLQSMEIGTKTASIFLEDTDGEIFIQNGSLVHARQGNFTGNEALTRIFLLEKGRFRVNFNEMPADISGEPIPLTSVLMNVMSDVDEIHDIIERIGGKDRMVTMGRGTLDFPESEKIANLLPISFIECIVRMNGDLKKNIRAMNSAVKEGTLRII
jgi:DNA-binding response OmpR family regulator